LNGDCVQSAAQSSPPVSVVAGNGLAHVVGSVFRSSWNSPTSFGLPVLRGGNVAWPPAV
jgi:hypothetical protein